PVLDRGHGIEGFDLDVHFNARGCQAIDAHDGRAPDGVEDAVVDHGTLLKEWGPRPGPGRAASYTRDGSECGTGWHGCIQLSPPRTFYPASLCPCCSRRGLTSEARSRPRRRPAGLRPRWARR